VSYKKRLSIISSKSPVTQTVSRKELEFGSTQKLQVVNILFHFGIGSLGRAKPFLGNRKQIQENRQKFGSQ
jgi:hypothetical protein